MVAAEREIMFNLTTQHKLGVLQWLIVEQPIQFCPLCRGVAVLVLDSDAVNGNGGAIREPGFHPVGVHVVAAGKQFVHSRVLHDLILMIGHSNQYRQVVVGWVDFSLFQSKCTVFARFQNVQRVQIVAKSDKGCRNYRVKNHIALIKNNDE